jgi:LPXTG-motif cell wall-anchored protein
VNRFKVIAFVFCLALVATLFVPNSDAQNRDKRTTVTFTEPIEIPGGVILQPGVYVFHLLGSWENRYVVQISNEREDHMYATVITVANERRRSTSKTVMTFNEREAGAPPAIHVWFFPGDTTGREFVYPKTRAIQLAKLTNEPVLAMPVEMAPNITAPVATPEDAPVVALKEAPITVIQPTGEEVPVTAVVETPKPAPVEVKAPEVAPVTDLPLPHTASSMPLIGLIGLLSILAASGLWFLKKRAVA